MKVMVFLVEKLGNQILLARDEEGWTSAHSAARAGDLTMLKYIVETAGVSPLMILAGQGARRCWANCHGHRHGAWPHRGFRVSESGGGAEGRGYGQLSAVKGARARGAHWLVMVNVGDRRGIRRDYTSRPLLIGCQAGAVMSRGLIGI